MPNERMPINADLAARGFTLERCIVRHRTPRNGNVRYGSPGAPQYEWILKLHGKIVGSGSTKRYAISLASPDLLVEIL